MAFSVIFYLDRKETSFCLHFDFISITNNKKSSKARLKFQIFNK